MKLLLYLPDLDGGGAQRTLLNLASVLLKTDGIDLRLVTGPLDGPAVIWCPDGVDRVTLPAGRARAQVVALRRAIRDFDPDIALSTMLHGNLALYLATRLMQDRPKIVLRETNSHLYRKDLKPWHTILAGIAYRAADRMVALSDGVRRELVARYRLSPVRCVTIHNPVDLSAVPQRETRADGFHFLSIGRLSEQKNHALLLRAFAALRPGDARLTILGEGPLRRDLESLATELGIADRVALPGFVSDTGAVMKTADAFVLSSRYEGFGHVLVEAMAAGLPVISTDCPYGPADIIRNGETGILVQNGDAEELSEAMNAIRSDADLSARLSASGPVRARDFDAHRIGARYVTLFNECLAE